MKTSIKNLIIWSAVAFGIFFIYKKVKDKGILQVKTSDGISDSKVNLVLPPKFYTTKGKIPAGID